MTVWLYIMPHVFAHLFVELYGKYFTIFLFFNSQRSPRPIWSMRTSWPWRCLCSSLWTTTLPVSMWPSLKGSLWVIRETTLICLESGASWEMKRWDCLKYFRETNVLQLNSRISSSNMTICILYLVCPWGLSDWADHTAAYRHGWKTNGWERPRGSAAVSDTLKFDI